MENYKNTAQMSQCMGLKIEDKNIIKYALLPNTVVFGGPKERRDIGMERWKKRENNWKYIYLCKEYIGSGFFFLYPVVSWGLERIIKTCGVLDSSILNSSE